MAFGQSWQPQPHAPTHRIAVLSDGQGAHVEIAPGLGFNAYRWRSGDGSELLYATPKFFEGDRPTRSGIPVLFPFPNRIRAGRFAWNGNTYQLALGDPSGKNAIHGFVVGASWRVVDAGADGASAWITGEFQGSIDAPATLALWPADYRLRLTCRLRAGSLALEAEMVNPGAVPLPCGLGYHPYFAVAPFGGEEAVVSAPAARYWELQESLPTGRLLVVDAARDLQQGRPLAGLQLDDVLTDLRPTQRRNGLGLVGCVAHPTVSAALMLWTSDAFRDLVAFTPPHRQAVCLEPYTCTTDALNLQQQGRDAGLIVLAPGESRQTSMVLSYSAQQA